ncbi:HD-GYP domain-containing protein [Cognatilysobacter terrigena]|uniref:HD-GYP domain-containing protein n=1 Tax=Cognatilysobacter terrigena TaxID=2488749 RepID=UPI00105C61B1|nr:HD-GYP domain-containing protein [Lysobacter terrigena]
MQIEEREIEADQVRLGMFVCRLDRPWTDTPFPLQGFYVSDLSQIQTLRNFCRRVWIDVELSQSGYSRALNGLGALSSAATQTMTTRDSTPAARPAAALPRDPRIGTVRYHDTVDFDHEIPSAREALEVTASTVSGLVDQAQAGQSIEPEVAHAAARPVVASVLRNADAMFWLNALRRRDGYAYSHALNGAMFAAAFGRHLGLPEDYLIELATGAMLMDIGKTQVPAPLLDRDGPLDAMSMARVRRHVELGAQMLQADRFSRTVIEMVNGHHERADGSGYPARRSGAEIPLHARIAAIVDSFDAMTSDRPHAAAMPRHVALQELYRDRVTRYYPELVEQFISCLGVYPTGSLAELNTGEIVAIMSQNSARRLRPRVLVLTDPDGTMLRGFRTLDLLSTDTSIEIRRPLPDRHAGIDVTELYL